jgi:hypothetical protein
MKYDMMHLGLFSAASLGGEFVRMEGTSRSLVRSIPPFVRTINA